MSTAIVTTDAVINTTASYPKRFAARPLPGCLAASRRCASSITSTSIGTAAMPLSTALQYGALIGSIGLKQIAMPTTPHRLLRYLESASDGWH